MQFQTSFKQFIFAILLGISGGLQASPVIEEAFPGAVIEPELLPLMREFISLSDRANIALPLQQVISRVQFVPQDQMPQPANSNGRVMAITSIDPKSHDTYILLSDQLRSSRVELKILLMHELLHAAGFDHPKNSCHWAEAGCGIMGRSPYPFRSLSPDHADFVIRSSFKTSYLAKLPRVPL